MEPLVALPRWKALAEKNGVGMSWFFEEHWPWWLGAIGLSTVTLGIWIIERRALGVSGCFGSLVSRSSGPAPSLAPAAATDAIPTINKPPLPRTVHLTFLLAMIAGGAISSLLAGGWTTKQDLGPTHAALIGERWMLPVLVLGGILTGIGSRMAGGCTSGHGLSGCSRMRPNSMVATAAYFGTGVLLSFVLAGRLH